jgi:hypothetical protein
LENVLVHSWLEDYMEIPSTKRNVGLEVPQDLETHLDKIFPSEARKWYTGRLKMLKAIVVSVTCTGRPVLEVQQEQQELLQQARTSFQEVVDKDFKHSTFYVDAQAMVRFLDQDMEEYPMDVIGAYNCNTHSEYTILAAETLLRAFLVNIYCLKKCPFYDDKPLYEIYNQYYSATLGVGYRCHLFKLLRCTSLDPLTAPRLRSQMRVYNHRGPRWPPALEEGGDITHLAEDCLHINGISEELWCIGLAKFRAHYVN